MIRILFILIAFTGFITGHIENPAKFKAIEEDLKLHWKAEVGAACFRGNILTDGDKLIFGSNGNYFRDAGLFDLKSGIYFINRSNGKISKKFGNEKIGDMDVNGILLHNDRLYYGNDNEEFICSSKNGDIIWRNPASGDIEHEPVLIKSGNRTMIVYASEYGEVCAVDPETGKKYWSYFSPDFKGWKPGENRAIFKVKSFFSNTNSFFIKPELADINADGVDDLIYLTYDQKIIALSGINGKSLWIRDLPDRSYGLHISNVNTKSSPVFVIKETFWNVNDNYKYNSSILFLNKKGEIIDTVYNDISSYSYGLNSIHTPDGKTIFALRDTLLITDASGKYDLVGHERNYTTINYNNDTVVVTRNHYNPLFAQAIFSYKGFSNCILVLHQNDRAYFENGFIEIISLDSKKVIETYQLPMVSEMPPVIGDINKDGQVDLMISGEDGYLYCYDLGVPNSNLKYTTFKK